MSLATGTRLGPYEIVAPLGAGGMGDVYRGRDTRLARHVAIKVLSAHLATDPQFRLRFEREARAISSLEHPNICTLFDVGEQGDISYLVMPLLDGETLADRLSGPGGHDRALPVREALRIASEIASAVEAAHEHGIIHRDLKPANIFVLRDGTAKILDFGLAKDSRSTDSVATHETALAAPTEPGLILGTAAYMSPEQVRGLAIDRRSDVWAFGCVLYQMLSGRRPFAGQTPSDVMAAILEREPDWTALPPSLPDGIVRLLRRCLRKETRDRLHDIADARIEIQDAREQPESAVTATVTLARGRERLFFVLAVAATVAALALGAARLLTPRLVAPPETRLDIVTPPTADPASMAISPDGRTIAFVASTNGAQRIWLRRLDGTASRELMGTENGESAVLVAGRPISRILYRRQVEAHRSRRGRRQVAGGRGARRRRYVGSRRHDPLWSNACQRALQGLRGRRRRHRSHDARTTAGRPPVAILPPRHPALSLLRRRRCRDAGRLCRVARWRAPDHAHPVGFGRRLHVRMGAVRARDNTRRAALRSNGESAYR